MTELKNQTASDWQALADLINGTAEVQVTIVTTVTVPTVNGRWTHGDAIKAAAWSANEGYGHYEAHQVGDTGAPQGPQDRPPVDVDEVTQDLAAHSADEATSWTPGLPGRHR